MFGLIGRLILIFFIIKWDEGEGLVITDICKKIKKYSAESAD